MDEPDATYILGDIDAFLAALDTGVMQAQWEKDRARCQAWLSQTAVHTPTRDAAED